MRQRRRKRPLSPALRQGVTCRSPAELRSAGLAHTGAVSQAVSSDQKGEMTVVGAVKAIKKVLLATVTAVAAMPVMFGSAQEIIDQTSVNNSSTMSVEHNVDLSYKVTIPANVTFTNSEKIIERSLQASEVYLNDGDELNIYVTSLNDFKMVNKTSYIEYDMLVNSHPIPTDNSSPVLTVQAGDNSGWAVLRFNSELNSEHMGFAGNYSDTLTFTVKVE